MGLVKRSDTDVLLKSASQGDTNALTKLFGRYRRPLKRMIQVRLDSRVRTKVDPSDVVQETLLVATTRLATYAATRPLPFYPWLRQIAGDRLVDLHRRYLKAKKRAVARDEALIGAQASSIDLAGRLICAKGSPDANLLRTESIDRVHKALDGLNAADREILVMRHLEELTTTETAEALGITQSAAKLRLLRALKRLRIQLSGTDSDD